ncbi:ABC transporter ATP-binding protein [Compostibacter hankyongensis]|uniref:ABC transporter ATP-binding protein n=1 Tax=Compostibacter hankyongensis TaxID=1007089 RepID=A0ABP8G0E1_9BACT
MDYNLYSQAEEKTSTRAALNKLLHFMAEEKKNLFLAMGIIMINSGINLLAPFLLGYTIDHYVQTKQYSGVLTFSALLLGLYLIGLATRYWQTQLMGGVGQRMLFSLRNAVFGKLQELPVAFFNQNKAGDLISRINNDTDKVNQFFSQSLVQFIDSIFIMLGAGIFLLSINTELGAASLGPALLLLIFTKVISPWVKRKNAASMKSTGGLSSEIQESLNNFKVIIAFNRRDYFRQRFDEANRDNYRSALGAGLANNLFMPVFTFCANIAQLVVLAFGIYLIAAGHFTIGLLISFLAYVNSFYMPLRQLAALWANFQIAMAAWDRISRILSFRTDLLTLPAPAAAALPEAPASLLRFEDVSFRYPDGKEVLHHINLDLKPGKTYALVGPTGGGKTTTASLIARLYDPTEGEVLLAGKDIRSYTPEERSAKIGFILQDPFLFTGTLRDNIVYGDAQLESLSREQLEAVIAGAGLSHLLERFEKGLDTEVAATGDSISLGQKQLIAFIRAVLRRPELLILDEATANIDTVTEQLLEDILQQLPAETTRVIIAHRLNTIENADEIYFVNAGNVVNAGSLDHAMHMLLHDKRES